MKIVPISRAQGSSKSCMKAITEPKDIEALAAKHSLHVEFWLPEGIDETEPDLLKRYQKQIEALEQRFGYKHADVVELGPNTPGLKEILSKFDKEHHHTDDEVRATVKGSGIFTIRPIEGDPFQVHVGAGDLIIVPAGTRHWFNLPEGGSITCIRVFKDNPQWAAVY